MRRIRTSRVRRSAAALLALIPLAMAAAASPASAAPVFTPLAAEMSAQRYMPAADTLPNGKVLIAGGYTGKERVKSAELFDPASGKFGALSAELAVPLAEPANVTLPNGKVLIAGGYNEAEHGLKTAELFNPATEKFEATGELVAVRDGGAAALLHDGKVLLVGGEGVKGILKTAELYDPETGKFSALAAEASVARYAPVAVTLPDGKVLVAGGSVFGGEPHSLNSAELFNPETEKFEGQPATMAIARTEAAFAPLANGEVLIAGGYAQAEEEPLASSEVFNPGTLTFEPGANLNTRRDGPAAALLHDGTVLILGGATPKAGGGFEYVKSAELASPGPPTATTGAAAGIGTTSGTLTGVVLSREAPATAYFQYGKSAAYGAATAPQGVAESLVNAVPVSAAITGLAPGTAYHYRVVGEVGGRASFGADQTFTTAAAPKPALQGLSPALTKIAQSAARWREGKALARISRRAAPLGTTFSFTLNTPATVSFRFTQTVGGRRVGHKCVAKSKHNARRRACKRTITAGTLTFAGHAGVNHVVFQGRLSSSKKLRLGRYTLTITARNAAGLSNPALLGFTIVK